MFTPRSEDITAILSGLERELKALGGSKIFLAGAAGFLGRYFMSVISEFNKFHDNKITVHGADNFVSSGEFGRGILKNAFEGIELHNVDVGSMTTDDLKLASSADLIVHGAGIASPQQYKALPLKTIDVAVNGARNLLETSKANGSKFIFFSSSEIYGNPPPEQIPIKENFKGIVSSTGPRACYDESKRLGETLCSVFHSEFGLHTNIIRPFNVYGPGMQKTDYRVMPNFAFRIKEKRPIEVYGSGTQTRTYCYISDAIIGFIKVFANGHPGEAYNIGNPNQEISAFDLAVMFREICLSSVPIEVKEHPTQYPADEPDRRCPSIQKANDHLDYYPTVDLETGIRNFSSFINA